MLVTLKGVALIAQSQKLREYPSDRDTATLHHATEEENILKPI